MNEVHHLNAKIIVKADAAVLKDRFIAFVLHNKGRIQTQAGTTVKAEFGSGIKTRILGTWLGGYSSYPIEIILSLFAKEDGTHVEITARDALGFCLRKGIESGVQNALLDKINEIKEALNSVAE